MKVAKTPTGRTVDAVDAQETHQYFCGECRARVYLTRGRTQVPHFRHIPNESTTKCRNYVAGSWSAASTKRSLVAVEDSANEPGVGLDLSRENAWALFVRIPEIPNEELGPTSLAKLQQAHVTLRVGGVEIERLPALEIRPGVGVARMQVPPSTAVYQLAPAGTWPMGIALERWKTWARGMNKGGTAFRLRRGEWVRIRVKSPLAWGERIHLIAEASFSIPRCRARSLGSTTFGGVTWTAHQITLPTTVDDHVERWFANIDIEIVEPGWLVTLVSVPREFDASGLPIYSAGETVVGQLRAPEPNIDTFAHVAGEGASDDAPITANGRARAFVKFTTRTVGRYTLAAGDVASSRLVFGVREPLTLSELRSAVGDAPRLVVRIGDEVVEGWGVRRSLPAKIDFDALSITTTAGALEIEVRFSWTEQSLKRHAFELLSAATTRLRQLAKDIAIEFIGVDAGPLGSMVLERKAVPQSGRTRASRVAGYVLAQVATSGAPAQHAEQVFAQRRIGHCSVLLSASERPTMVALVRAVARGAR